MARTSNRQIVKELQSGDRIGCSHLMQTYENRLLSEAVTTFGLPVEDSEELVSDVLLTVVQKIQGFVFKKGDGDFHLWVMTIFRNRVRDFVRHRAAVGIPMEGFLESAGDGEEQSNDVSRQVVKRIVEGYQREIMEENYEDRSNDSPVGKKLKVIAETLEGMETWERVLLRCRALDVSYEEIAGYTGKPVRQLKVYHGRVKKKFIKLLSERYPELMTSTGVGIEHEA